jgi:hypothetical protein
MSRAVGCISRARSRREIIASRCVGFTRPRRGAESMLLGPTWRLGVAVGVVVRVVCDCYGRHGFTGV